jgi:hypothetical protein
LHQWKFFEAQLDNALVFQSVIHVSYTGHCVLESDVHIFTTGEKWTKLHILYRVIHDLWRLLQEMISRFLWTKNLIQAWVLFWMVTELWVLIVVNTFLWTAPCKSHYAILNQLEQQESAEAAICNWQLALFITKWQCELWPAVAFLITTIKCSSL